jgi:hypothetical protein
MIGDKSSNNYKGMVMLRPKILMSILLCLFVFFTSFQSSAVFAQTAATIDDPVLVMAGEQEIVFDWTTDRCDFEDIPDLPARAFRDGQDRTQLIATHYVGRRSIGASLNDVTRDCTVIMTSDDNADPSMYSDKSWIAGLYTEDGNTIYALIHNEYQGHRHSGQCPSGEYFNCWYNAITMAVSTDGGASYIRTPAPPDHFVATLPYVYEPDSGPYGILEPSNIIRGQDGYYYAFIRADDIRSPNQWICLMRTDNLADPRSWRGWDGAGFDLAFVSPYQQESDLAAQEMCAPISTDTLGVMAQSVTYNTYLNRYVMVGSTATHIDGREVWGVFYAFSDDLIHWTQRQLLFETELTWTYVPGDSDPILYPSLLDPDSPSRNYETTDQTAYVYFTQFNYENGQMTLDRDLVRVPVRFFRSAAEAENPEAVTNLTVSVTEQRRLGTTLGGTLTDYANAPIPDAPIEVASIPTSDEALEFVVSGQVPANATRALVGYRVNMECGCTGTADFLLYEARYTESGEDSNHIANADFSVGLSDWYAWGTANNSLAISDRTNGQMMAVFAESGQTAGINSGIFAVTEGADYTVTFVARVNPSTTDSGYFALMFMDNNAEFRRETIPLTPNVLVLGETVTDADGHYEARIVPAIDAGSIVLASFMGSDDHFPASAQLVVDAE